MIAVTVGVAIVYDAIFSCPMSTLIECLNQYLADLKECEKIKDPKLRKACQEAAALTFKHCKGEDVVVH